MLRGYTIIDADGHVHEPDDLWQKRLAPEFRARAPVRKDGLFRFGEVAAPKLMSPDLRAEIAKKSLAIYPEAHKASWSPESQVKGMDQMGLDVSFLYPTSGLHMWWFPNMDPPLAAAIARAYNDWIYEFTQYDPKRLKPVAGLSLQDPNEALRELERVTSQMGARAVFVRPNPVDGRTLGDPAYEPIWRECERLGVSIGLHEGTAGTPGHVGADRFRTFFALHTSHASENMLAFLSLLEGGVFERHPTLRFAFLECGCGWVPYWLYRLDHVEYSYLDAAARQHVKMKPSEYFRRQCYVSTETEPYLGRLVDFIGEDRILFGSDYPHPDHEPDITEELVEMEDLVSKRVLKKILYDNPRAFYGIT